MVYSLRRSGAVTQLLIFIFAVLSLIPPAIGLWLGGRLGVMLYYLLPQRRRICEINVEIFKEHLGLSSTKNFTKKIFEENGRGLIETAWAWFKPRSFWADRLEVQGEEKILAAMSAGNGVLLLCPHYSMVDVSAPLLHQIIGRFIISYRPHENKVIENILRRSRSQYGDLVPARSIRKLISALRSGEVVWFAPDQDMGLRGTVFAPFFGRMAATVVTPSLLYESSHCTIFLMSLKRSGSVYQICFHPVTLENSGKNSRQKNAESVNEMITKLLSKNLTQYMWMHRRFKSDPKEKKGFFYDH